MENLLIKLDYIKSINNHMMEFNKWSYKKEIWKLLTYEMSLFEYDYIIYYINTYCIRNKFNRQILKDLRYIIRSFLNMANSNMFENNVSILFKMVMDNVAKEQNK